MVACICCPALDAEMDVWVSLGGGNSGCCGNAAHTYGFHLPGGNVPVTDYSRSHEPGRPYNMAWACAADFSHKRDPRLRAMHATLITRLMAGDPSLHMVCEFIGQPWADQPVYYWSAWERKLKRYTGSGHDHWSHVSLWRSKANLRPNLWVPPSVPLPTPTPTVPVVYKPLAPAYPGYNMVYNPRKFDANLKRWQSQMRKRGWRIIVDGVYGPDTRRVVRAFQADKRLGVDGIIGPRTWAAAWTAPIT